MSAESTASTDTVTPVPPLDLAGDFAALRDELLAEIHAVCDSGQYVLGRRVEQFETDLAGYCGSRYALGVTSGTDALLIALTGLNVGRGDEVIVPALTFFATAGVVHRVGATPVFADIDPDTFNLDPNDVAGRITQRTRAVIPVHLYGRMASLPAIFKAVNRFGIHVIEDAAQSIGAALSAYPDRRSGAIGTCGAISFYPTKNLGAIGDAGALLTNDERLFEVARKLRVHGSGHTYYHDYVGGNFRIDTLQAAILRVKLRHLDAWNARRAALARRYDDLLTQAGVAPEFVELPQRSPVDSEPRQTGPSHVYHQYVIRAQRRDELLEHLRARKIGAGVYYPLPLHLQKCFAYLGCKPGDFPHSERAAAEVLSLPIYPELAEDRQDAVVAAVESFYKVR